MVIQVAMLPKDKQLPKKKRKKGSRESQLRWARQVAARKRKEAAEAAKAAKVAAAGEAASVATSGTATTTEADTPTTLAAAEEAAEEQREIPGRAGGQARNARVRPIGRSWRLRATTVSRARRGG